MSKKKIAILSNVTVDLVKQKLKREYEVYTPEGFDTWVQEAESQDMDHETYIQLKLQQ